MKENKLDAPRNRKWTKETVLAEADRHPSRSVWQKKSPGSYSASRDLGLQEEIEQLFGNKPAVPRTRKWTKETVLAEAARYPSRSEWRKKSQSSYLTSRTLDITEELDQLFGKTRNTDRKKKWTKETVLAEAARHPSRSVWRDKSPGSFYASRTFRIEEELNRIFGTKRAVPRNRKWTKETVLAEAARHPSRVVWQEKSKGSYLASRTFEITEELDQLFGTKRAVHRTRKWTKEAVLAEAYRHPSRSVWHKKSPGSYSVRHAYLTEADLEQIFGQKQVAPRTRKWTKKAVLAEAARYPSRAVWRDKSPGSYSVRRNFCTEKEIEHIFGKKWGPKVWTKEAVLAEAARHRSRTVWRYKSPGSYFVRHDFLTEAEIEQIFGRKLTAKWTKETVLAEAARHPSRTVWRKKSQFSYILRHDFSTEQELEQIFGKKKTQHTPRRPCGTWTLEAIVERARQFATRKEWLQKCRDSYVAAMRMRVLDDPRLPQPRSHLIDWTRDLLINHATTYSSIAEFKSMPRLTGVSIRLGCNKDITKLFSVSLPGYAKDILFARKVTPRFAEISANSGIYSLSKCVAIYKVLRVSFRKAPKQKPLSKKQEFMAQFGPSLSRKILKKPGEAA